MERKRKSKSLWAFFIWLIWLLVAPGCAYRTVRGSIWQ